MNRVLLLLPTHTYRAPDFMRAATALGVEVVVASEQRHVLAESMGDRVIEVHLRRPEIAADAIVEFAEETPLDAIVAADDQGVMAAALAGERLRLRHNTPAAAARTRNKASMRDALAAAGVPQPDYRVIRPDSDVARAAGEVGWPCVLKPLSLAASQGVIRADDARTAVKSAARIRSILAASDSDNDEELLVERFVPGAEVAVEGLLHQGELDVLAIFDKPDAPDGPYFEETLFVTPSRLSGHAQAAITRATADAVRALELTEGPIHAELRVGDEGVHLLEVAARSIGGLCSRALRFGLGITLEQLILRHALDMPIRETAPSHPAAGVMMLPTPRAGVLREVRGREDAQAVPGIAGLEITMAPGGEVRPLPEIGRYLGFMFARGKSPAEVEQALRTAQQSLEVVIEDA